MHHSIKIIAEAEVNHNGDVELAKKLVEKAHECGADIVKFQCFVANSFIAPGSPSLPVFQNVELRFNDFKKIRDHAKKIGIEMCATAVDLEGLKMIVDLDLPVIKIGSTNITNIPLIEKIAETGKAIYLSTGASYLDEVKATVDILSEKTDDITLFHCTALYPAPDNTLNLRSIPTLANAFPSIKIGYSDHSVGNEAAVAAIALGATILERHFTLDHDLPGPDHGFSTDPAEMIDYVKAIRKAEIILGSGDKIPSEEEQPIRIAGRRHLTAAIDISAGAEICEAMLTPRRIEISQIDPALLLRPEQVKELIGKIVKRSIAVGQTVFLDDIKDIS